MNKEVIIEILSFLKQVLPLIGVFFGFFLSQISAYFQNKPKVKMELKNGSFKYFAPYISKINGAYVKNPIDTPSVGTQLEVEFTIDIYNYGKGNTAIKEVRIEPTAFKRVIRYYFPEIHINKNEIRNYSFNLSSNSINTLDLKLFIKREEETEFYFGDDISFDPEDKNRLYFRIIVTDIKGNKTKLEVDAVAIFVAS